MARNKVIYYGETLIDISDTTLTRAMLPDGIVAYNAKGERMVGVPTEAYAVLDANGILTFFRSPNQYTAGTGQTVVDIDGNTYTGEVFTGLETLSAASDSDIPWYSKRNSIVEVKCVKGQTIKPISLEYWFYYCQNAISIDLSSFDTSNVTSMIRMFHTCAKVTHIDVSSFDTSKVTSMYSMFPNLASIEELDLSNFDTRNVTTMAYMIHNCQKLKSVDVSNFDTSNVTSFYSMFNTGKSLTTLDLSSFDTGKANDMTMMFNDCNKLTTIYAKDWYKSSQTVSSNNMFAGCTLLPGFSSSAVTWTKARVRPNGYFTSK